MHAHTHDTGTTDIKRNNRENIRKNKLVSSKSMYFDSLVSREVGGGGSIQVGIGLKDTCFYIQINEKLS